MPDEKDVKATIELTRRTFLKYAGAGMILPTVVGMVPGSISGPLGWKAYAQSEKGGSDELMQLASKYGKPQGKFGKIGDPVTLTVGYQPYCTPYWTSSVNKQAAIWEKYLPKGSKVVWFRSLSGPLINNNMVAGKNQVGYMAETPALRSGDTVDCDMVCVTGYDMGETGAFCMRNDLIKDGKIKGPKDLEGERIGTPFGSYSHRQCLTWSYQNNVKPNFLDQSTELQVTNLRANNIVAAVTWEPYPTWLEQREISNRWITGQDMPCSCKKYIPEAPDHTYRVVGTTLAIFDWLRDRPDIISAYLKSEEECRDMLTNNLDLAAYYIWSDITEVHPAVVRVVLDMMVWDGRITPVCRQHLKGCARMWRENKILSGKRTEDPDKFVDSWADDSYLKLAIKEMKAQGQWTSDQLPGFPNPVRPDQLKRHDWKTYEKINLQEKPWSATKI
jgi:NitT/TauT family transport system substrate-binding protein